jgi:hypothetical protein
VEADQVKPLLMTAYEVAAERGAATDAFEGLVSRFLTNHTKAGFAPTPQLSKMTVGRQAVFSGRT